MNKKIIWFLIACISLLSQLYAHPSEVADTIAYYGFRIYLSDKDGSPYSISRPEEFLSQRAIDKRNRFQIPITEEDLPINPAYVNAIRQLDTGFHVRTQSKWTNTLTLFTYDTTHLASLRQLTFVDSLISIDNYYLVATSDTNSTVTSSPGKEVDTSFYGYGYRQIALHNGHLLHNEGYRGSNMLIAVIDAGWMGFDQNGYFQDHYNQQRVWGTYNIIPFAEGVYNLNEHGTYCTSLIATDAAYELVGTAPEANFVFIRTEDVRVERLFEEDFWARGAELADSLGADVISSSLGYYQFDQLSGYNMHYSHCDGRWSIASRAATIAAHKGIIVCVAAGNEGASSWHKVSRPGDADEILCVGAVNADSLYAPFSSCGPSYDNRVKPDVASCGWNAYVTNSYDMSVFSGSGTSFATPIIAGLAACLWQAIPQLSALEIMQIIRENGHQYQNPDTLLGYGIPDFYRAWQSHHSDKVDSYTRIANFSVYPNPCLNSITLFNSTGKTYQTELYDLRGRLLQRHHKTDETSVKVDLSTYPAGLYLLKIMGDDQTTEIKEIIKK